MSRLEKLVKDYKSFAGWGKDKREKREQILQEFLEEFKSTLPLDECKQIVVLLFLNLSFRDQSEAERNLANQVKQIYVAGYDRLGDLEWFRRLINLMTTRIINELKEAKDEYFLSSARKAWSDLKDNVDDLMSCIPYLNGVDRLAEAIGVRVAEYILLIKDDRVKLEECIETLVGFKHASFTGNALMATLRLLDIYKQVGGAK